MFTKTKWIIISIALLFSVPGCKNEEFIKSTAEFRTVYLFNPLDMAIFMAIDVARNGKNDDFTWMKAETNDSENVSLFYNESYKKGKLYTRTWYGPNNYKLVEKVDLNDDGRLETTTYYNYKAKAGVIGLIVARIEVDQTNNQKTDIWIYPETRMEIDTNSDGQPDLYTIDKDIINKNRSLLRDPKSKNTDLKGNPLPISQSWALNPHLIKNPEFQAIIPRSL